MDKIKVFDDLYQFNTHLGFIDLTFNQFLLTGSESLLVHTGSRDQTEAMIPLIKDILGNSPLSYVFVSHFESDECGGLSLLKEHFPQVKTVCSQVTARQLSGFGITNDIIAKNSGDFLETDNYKFKFISYPSEMHLWEGLLAFEEKRGLIFSSDLFIRFGKLQNVIEKSVWQDEIQKISVQQIPSPTALKAVQEVLGSLPVKYIIPGHGPCLSV